MRFPNPICKSSKNSLLLCNGMQLVVHQPQGLTYTQFHTDCAHVFDMCDKKKTGLQSASVQLDSDSINGEKIKIAQNSGMEPGMFGI